MSADTLVHAAPAPGAHNRRFPGDIRALRPYATAVNVVGRGDGETTDRPGVRAAVAGIVAYSIAAPLISLTAYVQNPDGRADVGMVALVLAAVPPLAWLSHRATRGGLTRGSVALLVVATVAISMAALIAGPTGWAVLYVPTALIAVMLPPAWSVLLLLGLAAAAAPLAAAAGQPGYALFYSFGVLIGVLPLVVSIRLVRSVRQLQAAQRELAARATERERLRIDKDLTIALVGALTDIAERAERAAAGIGAEAAVGEGELRALGAAARRTLAAARRVVREYRDVPLPVELSTAATLLAAAGIEARIEQPEVAPGPVDPAHRAALRHEIAALLASGDPTEVVLAVRDGRPEVHVTAQRAGEPRR